LYRKEPIYEKGISYFGCHNMFAYDNAGISNGHNERIRLETIRKSAEFYIRLIKQC